MKIPFVKTQRKLVDAGLEMLTKASRALRRGIQLYSIDAIDWDREEVEAFKLVINDIWTYVCINIVATSGANLPIGTYKGQPKTKGSEYIIQEDHWLTHLLAEPNPWHTGSDLIEGTLWSLRTSGQYFWELVGVKKWGDRPTEIYLLDPRQVKVIPDEKNYIKRYDVNVAGKWEPFQPWEISWGKHWNPLSNYDGLSPSTPAGVSVQQNIYAGKYGQMFFRNGGMPIGVMESDRRLGQPDYDRIQANWTKSVKSVKNFFKLLILEGGLKYKAVQSGPKDLALKDLKDQLKGEILAAHGVPRILAGDSKSVNYANAKAQEKLFWRNTLMPILAMIARRITKDLLSKEERISGKMKVMFDLTTVEALQEDQEIKSRIAFNLLKSLTMTPDETRRFLYKMQPHAGGMGAHLFIPSNMVTAEALLANNGKPLSGTGQPGQPGKPGGTQPGSKPDNQKPGANDGKPAKDYELELIKALAQIYREGDLEEFNKDKDSVDEVADAEYQQTILLG